MMKTSNTAGEEEQPSWLNVVGESPSQTMEQGTIQQPQQIPPQQQQQTHSTTARRCIKMTFFVINLGFMIMMSAAGFLGIQSAQSISDSSTIIVGLYMFLFAVIMGLYEILQIYPCTGVDTFYKKNFGFLYGVTGKCAFLIFMAVLCFGLVTPTSAQSTTTTGSTPQSLNIQNQAQQLAVATGILVGLWGIIQYVVYWKFPHLFDEKTKFQL